MLSMPFIILYIVQLPTLTDSFIWPLIPFVASTLQPPQYQTFVASFSILNCEEVELWTNSIHSGIHLCYMGMTVFCIRD